MAEASASPNRTALLRRRNSLIALGLAAILFVAVNVLAQALLTGARIDLTRDKLFTLSPGTRAILGRIDEPVTLRYFFSERLGREIPTYAAYAKRVQDMLGEFAAASRGRLVVEYYDPQPFSDVEDRAVALGLQAVPIDQSGETVFFGLSGTNSTDDKETIAFLAPERERFLEYDLARMVQSLANPKRKVVGLITDLPLEGDMMMMMRGMPTQPWFIMDTLRSMFEVRTLGGDFDRVPDDIDVLMLAHPKSVSDKTQYAIDQFVLKGGRALVFVDPYAESEAGRSRMMGGGPGGSDLPKLFQAWGVEMVKDKVAGDRANARRVNAGTPGRVVPADYVAWLTMRQGNINRDDPLMSNIGQVNMASAGILKKREGATTTLEPLITTSPQSMAVDVAKLSGGPAARRDRHPARVQARAGGPDRRRAHHGRGRDRLPRRPAQAQGRRRRRGRRQAGRQAPAAAGDEVAEADQRHRGGRHRPARRPFLGAGTGLLRPAPGGAHGQQRRHGRQCARFPGGRRRVDGAARARHLGETLRGGAGAGARRRGPVARHRARAAGQAQRGEEEPARRRSG